MSVVKSKRTPSHMQVIVNAGRIRNELEKLCLRNLGLRDPGKIARKNYMIGKSIHFDSQRYIAVIMTSKENIRLLAYEAQLHVIHANSIYPHIKNEAEQRRICQDEAIGTYNQLIHEFQHIIDVCNVDINIYRQYVDMIDDEIRLIKQWRKSDNKRKAQA